MTDPNSSLRLRDGYAIKFGEDVERDGKDAERIYILNNIVWEKNRPTQITLSATPSAITIGKSFNLTAIVQENRPNATTNQIINGEVVFTGDGIDGEKVVQTVDGKAQLKNISFTTGGEKNFKATFRKTSRYKASESNLTINVEKEQPILKTISSKIVYRTWKVAAKLLRSDGKTPIQGEEIRFYISHYNFYGTATTDEKGIVQFTLHDSYPTGYRYIKFKLCPTDKYKKTVVSKQYDIRDSESEKLSVYKVDLGEKNASKHTQKWHPVGNKYQCGTYTDECDKTDTIATSGTYYKPAILTIAFAMPSNVHMIKHAILKYTHEQHPGCPKSFYGGYFEQGLKTSMQINKDSPNSQTTKPAFSKISTAYGTFSTQTKKIITFDKSYNTELFSQKPIVKIEYPRNEPSKEECYIVISNLSLTITYVPTQPTIKYE